MAAGKIAGLDTSLILGRMALLNATRQALSAAGYAEVQTPILHRTLSGFEKGSGFSTFSASLGERLWLRAAPEVYLKRLLVGLQTKGVGKIFELALCLRDEFDEANPRESFDRPEFTLLELYAADKDPWALEKLLRKVIERSAAQLEKGRMAKTPEAKAGIKSLKGPWQRARYADLLKAIDPKFDLEALIQPKAKAAKGDRAALHATALDGRANDGALREASAALAYKVGGLEAKLRTGPQGYWYDYIDHAFRTKIAPKLAGPVLVYDTPLESSPLAESEDGVHAQKWELYHNGARIALGQRELMDPKAQMVRFKHLDTLRRLGYGLLPEPDEALLDELQRWPQTKPVIGMGVYMDRLAGSLFGIAGVDGGGQERMLPNLFKSR
jgi:lysyl-tRNA synthetase class 2